MLSVLIRGFICTTMLVGLPLLGITIFGSDIRTYLEFPPLTRYVEHAPFNVIAFIVISALDLLMVAGILFLMRHPATVNRIPAATPAEITAFPKWGLAGIAVMGIGWGLAWTRFDWFAPLQGHTFVLPWIGYILLTNALCYKRSGRSLMTDMPGRFLLLWPVSAVFWWFFEYLNRFVQNWYYVGVEDFSALEYTLYASMAFSTVLPAVLSTQRLLLTFTGFNSRIKAIAPLPFSSRIGSLTST